MSKMTQKLEKDINFFKQDIQNYFKKSVVSVILYGSAATDEYKPKSSDINFLVVLTDEGIQEIDKVQKMVSRWKKHKISLPLFVTKMYIESSLDSYPIEFFNMQCSFRVIYGEDVLTNLRFNKNDLRLQCERELKGKLLQLRQGFIMTRGKTRALQILISQSIVTFTSIFKVLLYLRDKEIPQLKSDVILEACREFSEIEEKLFSNLLKIRLGVIKASNDELESSIQRYINQIHTLSVTVDKMKF